MAATALYRPTYRLIGYTLIVGVLGALAAVGFDYAVDFAQEHLLEGLGRYHPPGGGELEPHLPQGRERLWLPLVTTLGGLLSGFLVYRFAPEAEGHGTDAAIAAYHSQGGDVRARIPLVKAVTSALTIGSGGVAGREGPTAQIAVGLGTVLANRLGLRGQERRTLLLAAMAAGLAAMFRAPLGMAIFAVEILYAGMVFESEALIYTVIAAVTSYAVFGLFAGGWTHIFSLPGDPAFDDPRALLVFALLGVLAGLLGAVLPSLLYRTHELFARLPILPHFRPAVGGLLVGLVALAVPEVLGTGYGWVEMALAGTLPLATALLLLALKGPAMALTIGSGGSGGVFAPTVTLGAMLGAVTGLLLDRLLPGHGIPVAAFVLVGMAAVFAAAARTPISTLIMVAEMTGGYGLIVPAMLANVLAFLVQRSLTAGSRYPTLYKSQVESREDSPLHRGVMVRRSLELIDKPGSFEPAELRLPRLVNLLRFGEPIPVAESGGMLVALEVEAGGDLDGRTVANSVGGIHGATAVAVLRGGEVLVPRGATRLEAGDRLLAVATGEAYGALRRAAKDNSKIGP